MSDDNCSVQEQAQPNNCYDCDYNTDSCSQTPDHISNNHSNSFNSQENCPSFSCIPQLDGFNDSLPSSFTTLDTSTSSISSLDQCEDQYSTFPKIYSANGRSIFPKHKDLIEKLQNHRIDIAQISESWQDITKKEHNDKIDELENRFGFKWYSFARKKFRDDGTKTCGGGTAVMVNQRNFMSSKLDISAPPNVEIIWVKVVPKIKLTVKLFIICGIYSKPNSKTKSALNDHIALNYHLLKAKYESIKFFFLGDFNDHKPDIILQLSPQLRQLVHYPTCGRNILDLIITDAHVLYHPPLPEAALLPDDPDIGAPSDHLGNLLVPRTIPMKNNRLYKNITVRPITQSQMKAMGNIIVNEKWEHIRSEDDINEKVELFSQTIFKILDEIAPKKRIKIACDDPIWMNTRIKAQIRQRNREYTKFGKSEKYRVLKRKCKKLCKEAKLNMAEKFIPNLRDKDPKTWMTNIKKLGRANHEKVNETWHFEEEQKSDNEITEEIANFFANISGHFTPVSRSAIPFIPPPDTPFVSDVNCFPEEHEVYKVLKTTKKTSSVPFDLPIPFVKEFLPELSNPIHDIFCKSIASGTFPTRWKTEYVSPLPKVLPPATYEDLRNISLTEFLSKSFERFLLHGTASVKGLLHYILVFFDPNQFAVPGASCSHALIKLIDFILKNTDNPNKPKAVINLLADWSKAFNKCNHNIIIRILITMNVPMWLIRIIISYLENRKMILRFRGCSSAPKDMPGGTPQGTLLGVILYILYINPVGFPAEVTNQVSDVVHRYWDILDNIPSTVQHDEKLPDSLQSIKFMDDATIQESIDLVTNLVKDSNDDLILTKDHTDIQKQIEIIKKLSDEREMSMNADKTFILINNFTHNHQFISHLQIPNSSEKIRTKDETKLLGYWLTSDVKPHRHVKHILDIAYKRLWAVTKLKNAGVPDADILHFFNIKIRSVLETNCPVFHSMLTNEDKDDIERIQKIVLKIILGDKYTSYEAACKIFQVESLNTRRTKICLSFALKCSNSKKFQHMFEPNTVNTHEKYKVPFAYTSRYQNSPKIFLTKLLNNYYGNQKKGTELLQIS